MLELHFICPPCFGASYRGVLDIPDRGPLATVGGTTEHSEKRLEMILKPVVVDVYILSKKTKTSQ